MQGPASPVALLPFEQKIELAERLLRLGASSAPAPLRHAHESFTEHISELANSAESDETLEPRLTAWIDAWKPFLVRRTLQFEPPFDVLSDYWVNFYNGFSQKEASADEELPRLPTRLLDFHLDFPFGVPACVLTPEARSIEFFARRGYELLTYKTVRDRAWKPQPFPQWAYAPAVTSPVSLAELQEPVVGTMDPGTVRSASISMVNSFGVPSLPPHEWQADIRKTRDSLSGRQVLIVSVAGSGDAPDTLVDAELTKQFSRASRCAEEAGADIVELNLSCPNTGGKGQIICESPELAERIVKSVHNELKGRCPLFIKLSYLKRHDVENIIERCQAYIQGVVAINTHLVPVRTKTGDELFPGRPMAGLSGVGIRTIGLEMCRLLQELRSRHHSDWVIVGVGGVTAPAHFAEYREAGADVVQSCTGAQLNPGLAAEIRFEFGSEDKPRKRALASVVTRVGELIATGGLGGRQAN